MERFKELTLSIKEKQEEMVKSKQILETIKKKLKEGQKVLPNQIMLAKQAGESLLTLQKTLDVESEEYITLKKEIENNKDGRVIVDYIIYPGVCIYISNRVYPVKDNRSRCQFRVDGADVVTAPI